MLVAPTAWRLIAPDSGVDVELPLAAVPVELAVDAAPSDWIPPWGPNVGAMLEGAAEARALKASRVLFVYTHQYGSSQEVGRGEYGSIDVDGHDHTGLTMFGLSAVEP